MDASELELFERSVRQATERHRGEALDAALTDLGWPDALAADPYGAVSVLFPLHGAALAVSSAVDQVVLTGLGLHERDAVVLPALGTWVAPGDAAGDRLSVRGLGTAALARSERAVVAARGDGGDRVAIATVATSELTLRRVDGVDPAFGVVEVSAERVTFDRSPQGSGSAWRDAVVLAQLALSYEMLGAARAMLALARDHAVERVQFGQTISRFQAVRHRLAETLVAIEGAESLVHAAREEPSAELAAIAKSLAGRAAFTAARHCQQVLAGIGFTTEHAFHLYFRRVLLLDQLFGSAHSLTQDLGEELLRSRQLPALLPL
jgi:alkylation response protein AidB-like acyl-CoA dehydrogenase